MLMRASTIKDGGGRVQGGGVRQLRENLPEIRKTMDVNSEAAAAYRRRSVTASPPNHGDQWLSHPDKTRRAEHSGTDHYSETYRLSQNGYGYINILIFIILI